VALTDEQRAMLQLLLEGGQGYSDIGSLLGISPEEVRSRARAALGEIGGADPDAQVPISDYLLGQADPIGRADAVRHLQSDHEANALAERLVAQLRLLAPKAQLPEVPAARGGRRTPTPIQPPPPEPSASTPPPPPAAPSAKRAGLASKIADGLSGLGRSSGKRRTQFTVVAAAGLALVIVAIVLVTGSGDGDEDGGDCSTIDTSQAAEAGIPTIKLVATGPSAEADCAPSGQITLSPVQQQGQQGQQQQVPTFALQINAANVEPSGEGDAYLLWLYRSDAEAFPLGQQTANEDGNLTGGVPLNSSQLLLLTAFDSVRLARATSAQVQQVQQSVQATSQEKNATGVVPFAGIPALEGPIAELGIQDAINALEQAQQGGGTGQGAQSQQGGQDSGAQ
jgi:hypothetical protein